MKQALEQLPFVEQIKLRKFRNRKNHKCFSCRGIIEGGGFYYSEELSDKYINFPQEKKFCDNCYKRERKIKSYKGGEAFKKLIRKN